MLKHHEEVQDVELRGHGNFECNTDLIEKKLACVLESRGTDVRQDEGFCLKHVVSGQHRKRHSRC